MFMLPNGAAGKNFVQEIIKLLNAWVENSQLKEVSKKAIQFMPVFFLQKPSKTSKTKDHGRIMEHRLELWHRKAMMNLLHEAGFL